MHQAQMFSLQVADAGLIAGERPDRVGHQLAGRRGGQVIEEHAQRHDEVQGDGVAQDGQREDGRHDAAGEREIEAGQLINGNMGAGNMIAMAMSALASAPPKPPTRKIIVDQRLDEQDTDNKPDEIIDVEVVLPERRRAAKSRPIPPIRYHNSFGARRIFQSVTHEYPRITVATSTRSMLSVLSGGKKGRAIALAYSVRGS